MTKYLYTVTLKGTVDAFTAAQARELAEWEVDNRLEDEGSVQVVKVEELGRERDE